MKKLVLMRHATYSRNTGNSDYEYALSSAGEKESKDAAKSLCDLAFRPDLILCSSATRAKQTACLMAPYFSLNDEAVLENKALYLCDSDKLLDILQEVSSSFSNVLLIAHNPGISVLTRLLSRSDAIASFPPSGFSVFDFNASSWNQAVAGLFDLKTVYYAQNA